MARIANLAMIEFAIIRAFPFPHSTAALALREKMKPQPRFKVFASILPEHFIADFARDRICSEAFRQGKNRSRSRFILGGRRTKSFQPPTPNPKAESSPNHFDSPVISYYFPPFSVSKLPVNVGRQIARRVPLRRAEGPNFCVFRPFFFAASEEIISFGAAKFL